MRIDYFKLALGNLRHRGIRSWLTMLGIFIGIAAVVGLISMGAGLKTAVLGQFGSLSVDTLTIQNKGSGFGPPGSTVVEKLNDRDVELIESVQGVKEVVPRLIRAGSMEYNDIKQFGYMTNIPGDQVDVDFMYDNLNLEVESGKLLQAGETGKVLLGNSLKDKNLFGKEITVGKKVKINGQIFEVGGILKKSSSFQMNSIVFISTKDARELLDIENEWDLIVARVEDKDKTEEVAQRIEEKIKSDRHEKVGEESFTVETPLQALSAVNTILNIINAIVIGIAMISLFVGGVGIANTMYTSVIERTKEIGVMKAIGAENKDVLMIFLIEAGLLGLVGGIVGALIGLSGAMGISSIANSSLGTDLFRISINYFLLIGAVLFSFLVGVISGVLPAIQASKLNVVDALRK